MLLGAHVSIAGGLTNAPRNAHQFGCEVFQMFSRSPQGGPAPDITQDVVRKFRAACDENEQAAWYIHTPYYINLASNQDRIRKASIRIIREELERGSLLGAASVMTHLGSAKDMGEGQALAVVIDGLRAILDGYRGSSELLLEISAGAGMVIGDTFEELSTILKALNFQCGVCFDTQHAFASGYDIRTPSAVAATMRTFNDVIGLEHLKLSHCNDSKVGLGERKDRHEHIGKGHISEEGFRSLFAHPAMQKINFVLETEPGGAADDLALLKHIRNNVIS